MTDRKYISSANDFARDNGYPGAEYLQDWHGFKLFVADDDSFSGFPPYILVSDDSARFTTPEETQTILFA